VENQLNTSNYVANAGTTLSGRTYMTDSGNGIVKSSEETRNVVSVGQNDMPGTNTRNERPSGTVIQENLLANLALGVPLGFLQLGNPKAQLGSIYQSIENKTSQSMDTDPTMMRGELGGSAPPGYGSNPLGDLEVAVPIEYTEPVRERAYSVEMEDYFTRSMHTLLSEDTENPFSQQLALHLMRDGGFVNNEEAAAIIVSKVKDVDTREVAADAVRKMNEYKASLNDVQKSMSRLEKSHSTLQSSLESSNVRFEKTQSELITQRDYNNKLQSEHNNAIDQIDTQKTKINTLEGLVERSQGEIASLKSQIQTTHLNGDKSNQLLNNRIKQLENVRQQAEDALDSMRADYTQKEEQYKETISELRSKGDYSKLQIQTLIDKANQLGVNVSDLQLEKETLQSTVSELEDQLAYVQGELRDSIEALKEEKENHGTTTDKFKGLKDQLRALKMQQKELTNELAIERTSSSNTRESFKQTQMELEAYKQKDMRLVRELMEMKSKYSSVSDQLQEARASGFERQGYITNLEAQLVTLNSRIQTLSDVKTHAGYQEILAQGQKLQSEYEASKVKLTQQDETIGQLTKRYEEMTSRATQMEQGGIMVKKRLEEQLAIANSQSLGKKEFGSNKRSALDQGFAMIADRDTPDYAPNLNHNQSATTQLQVENNVAEMKDAEEKLVSQINATKNLLANVQLPPTRRLNLQGFERGNDARAALSAAFNDALDSPDPDKVLKIFNRQYDNAIMRGISGEEIKKAINDVIAHKFPMPSGGGGVGPLLEVIKVDSHGMHFRGSGFSGRRKINYTL
jgi:predicted  nucleic acid-binding Zn-ribbon protein